MTDRTAGARGDRGPDDAGTITRFQDHAARVRRRAEELEPAVRTLAEDLYALGRDLYRATADMPVDDARELWELVGWNDTTDATDLLAGHLVDAVQHVPTPLRYRVLCAASAVHPVRPEFWARRAWPDSLEGLEGFDELPPEDGAVA